MQKITPFLWFDGNAEEAAQFYVSVFPNSKITSVSHYPDAIPGNAGKVMTVSFQLSGQSYTALNGGPQFRFTEALSLVVHCGDQSEVDHYWNLLSAGGEVQACGWLKDKFGLSWQIVPDRMIEMLNDADRGKSTRVMNAMMQMKKIDLNVLENAYHQE